MERILELKLSAKKKKAFLLNESFPAVILLITGISTLKSGGNILLAAVNIFSGALLMMFGIREWRSLGKKAEHRYHWFDVISGLVMMADAVAMYKPWKGFQPAYLYAVLSVLIVLKGFSVVKFPMIRKVVITNEGLNIRTGPFSAVKVLWTELQSVSISLPSLILQTSGGKKTISLRSIGNIDELTQVLSEACLEKNIQYLQ